MRKLEPFCCSNRKEGCLLNVSLATIGFTQVQDPIFESLIALDRQIAIVAFELIVKGHFGVSRPQTQAQEQVGPQLPRRIRHFGVSRQRVIAAVIAITDKVALDRMYPAA